MPAQIQERKLSRLFELLDSDGSGFVEESDLEDFAAKAIAAAGAGGSLEARIVQREASSLWRALQQTLDSDGDQRVSRAEFVAAADADAVTDGAIKLGVVIRDITDIDRDGLISLGEWVTLDAKLGIPRADSEQGFKALDVDGDGYVSKPEYVRGVEQFFRSDDEASPGNWAFGKY
ncbi:calcium binding protein [Actinokineospora spheciospongiae]|uniref:Calcium binding protein n=1 Tax=Actinokineospora spheciospongiae TaxID=909613 RepID=W7J035_9PSEU|nr:EF-hand domain-containing protein [Actinokineospora spheciospongiae]EWC62216.1 calcium binding protein [Actinokineospora spheciospongiae]PWW59421.1 Ca2+-binding EF-hand superfamily protein [Actinokineospora spheciospongiae]